MVQALVTEGDIDLTSGDFVFATGPDAIAQHLRIRLRFVLGEWFFDQDIGMPYFEEILIKNPNTNVVTTLFRTAILSTPGVLSLDSLDLVLDNATRILSVTFAARISGSAVPLVFDEEFKIVA